MNVRKDFACGFSIDEYFARDTCDVLLQELNSVKWHPALVNRYQGNDLIVTEHDPNRSTALVTKDFQFKSLDYSALKSNLQSLVKERYHIDAKGFTKYGVSKYPVNSKLSLHADTGVYNTDRLITFVIYLESPSNGGEIEFPEVEMLIKPQKGMLLSFYSELKHSVRMIERGERIALIFFCT